MAPPPRGSTGGAGAADAGLRDIRADNPSPLTLDGTRTYLVGRRRVAIIDPGPSLEAHAERVAGAVRDAEAVVILLTHTHPDHAAAAPALARRLGAPVRAAAFDTLHDGDRIGTDAGTLEALTTPGHTPDHVAFHWPAGAAVFCGDLMLGGQDTALVAPPEGILSDYLASLKRVATLELRTIHPAHGPDITDPNAALERYAAHRHDRERQVLAALEHGPASLDALVDRVYGADLEPTLRRAATGATRAYLEHLRAAGRVRATDGRWARARQSGTGGRRDT